MARASPLRCIAAVRRSRTPTSSEYVREPPTATLPWTQPVGQRRCLCLRDRDRDRDRDRCRRRRRRRPFTESERARHCAIRRGRRQRPPQRQRQAVQSAGASHAAYACRQARACCLSLATIRTALLSTKRGHLSSDRCRPAVVHSDIRLITDSAILRFDTGWCAPFREGRRPRCT